jgi:hypothetical protein
VVLFSVIYLLLTLTLTIGIIRGLASNWHNYAKSQRSYMVGFVVMLSGMTQRAFGQILNNDPFAFSKSGLIMVGLAIVASGMLYGRDPRLQDVLDRSSPEELNRYLEIIKRSRRMDEESK